MRNAVGNDDITTIEQMIAREGINVNAVISVSIIISISYITVRV